MSTVVLHDRKRARLLVSVVCTIYSHMDVLSSGIVPPKLFGLGSLDIINDAGDAT